MTIMWPKIASLASGLSVMPTGGQPSGLSVMPTAGQASNHRHSQITCVRAAYTSRIGVVRKWQSYTWESREATLCQLSGKSNLIKYYISVAHIHTTLATLLHIT